MFKKIVASLKMFLFSLKELRIMYLGAMNNPKRNVLAELNTFASWGFDFPELAIEGPEAMPDRLLPLASHIKDTLSVFNHPPIAHVPWYFYVGHPYPRIRRAYIEETFNVLDVAAELGCTLVGLHIHRPKGLYQDKLEHNITALKEAAQHASDLGIDLAVENLEERTFSVGDFRRIFQALPEVKFLFDVGHANMGSPQGKAIFSFIEAFRDRIAHVHAHDNLGEDDDHLPIGAGVIPWTDVVSALKKTYDGTVTLEIHSMDEDYLRVSRKKFALLWER
jgi:sugar phosphate isomerase/epimerase